jgi:hypothetical protein
MSEMEKTTELRTWATQQQEKSHLDAVLEKNGMSYVMLIEACRFNTHSALSGGKGVEIDFLYPFDEWREVGYHWKGFSQGLNVSGQLREPSTSMIS